MRYIRKMFQCVDRRQRIDKKENNYEYWKKWATEFKYNQIENAFIERTIIKIKDKIAIKKEYVDLYFHRIYMTCANLFVLTTRLLIELTGYAGKEKKKLIAFAKIHGIMRQIVNDNIDFVKLQQGTIGKKSIDVFSDIKNGTITLPLIFHLDRCKDNSLVLQALETKNPYLLEKQKMELLKEMILTRALPDSMKIGRILANNCSSENYLDHSLKSSKFLINLSMIAYNNCFYHHIYVMRHSLKKV